jgi:hypothetical protein
VILRPENSQPFHRFFGITAARLEGASHRGVEWTRKSDKTVAIERFATVSVHVPNI